MAKRIKNQSKRQLESTNVEPKTTNTRAARVGSELPNPRNPGTLVANEHGITSTSESQLVDNSGGHQGDVNSLNGVRGDSIRSAQNTAPMQTTAVSAEGDSDCDRRIAEALEQFKLYLEKEKSSAAQPSTQEPVKSEEPTQAGEVKEEVKSEEVKNKDGWTAENMSIADSTKFTASAFTIIKSAETYSLLHVYVNPLGGEEARMKVVKEGLEKEAAIELLKQYSAKEIFDKLA